MATKKPTVLQPDLVELGNEPQRPIVERPTPVAPMHTGVSAPFPSEAFSPFEQLLRGALTLAAAGILASAAEVSLKNSASRNHDNVPKTQRTRRWRNLR